MLSHLASRGAPTGAEKSLAISAEGLARRGHRVVVSVPGPWLPAASAVEAGVRVVEIPVRACWLVQYQPQPFLVQAMRLARFFWFDPGRRRLERWLAGERPDVVLVNCLPHLRGAAVARSSGRPVVWYVREILAPGPRRRWFAGQLRANADRVVAVSRAVAAWLAEEGLVERVEVVHNGVDPPAEVYAGRAEMRAALGLSDDAVVAGYFGQLSRHKGPEDAIAAVEGAANLGSPVELVLAGPGRATDRARVERRIAASPIRNRVHLVEARPDAWPLLAAVDLVVVPTRWPDPLPRIVMEAMAAGRPVVGSGSGGIPEMVDDGETGILAPAGDVAALAEAVAALAQDHDLRTRLGIGASARARRHFSVAAHIASIERVLEAAVRAERGSGRAPRWPGSRPS